MQKPPPGNPHFPIADLQCISRTFIFEDIDLSASIRNYSHVFKREIIQKIVHFIDKNLSYSNSQYILKSTFLASKIFKIEPNRYQENCFVSGKIGSTHVIFCEMDTKCSTNPGKKSGRETLFRGLFCVCNVKKSFETQTVVLPDSIEKLFGNIGKTFQWWNNSRKLLVEFNDQEFQKNFFVYSKDHFEAKHIITSDLIKQIVNFKAKYYVMGE